MINEDTINRLCDMIETLSNRVNVLEERCDTLMELSREAVTTMNSFLQAHINLSNNVDETDQAMLNTISGISSTVSDVANLAMSNREAIKRLYG